MGLALHYIHVGEYCECDRVGLWCVAFLYLR
jgi:hypothetical protein